MGKESLPVAESEEHTYEAGPGDLPVVEAEAGYYDVDHRPELKEGVVVHYMRSFGWNEKPKNSFLLLKNIAGLNYIIFLDEYFTEGGLYQLNFKTEEYEYAVTNLDDADRDLLFSTVATMVESSSKFVPGGINKISIFPAPASYSAEEIEQCIEAILASPKNTKTKEELANNYKSFKIFDLYAKLFGKDFHEVHYNHNSKSGARARLFRSVIRKHFPDWEMPEQFSIGDDFYVRRKGSGE